MAWIRSLSLLLLVAVAWAVAQPATIASVYDGDTVRVVLHGEQAETKVRLLWIDTPEVSSNSHGEGKPEGTTARDALRDYLPVGTAVILWGPGEALEVDPYQRALAVVATRMDPTTGLPVDSAQHQMVAGGWSPVWMKYSEPPEGLRDALVALERQAEEAGSGAWGTDRKYMVDKRNERTAPQAVTAKPARAQPEPKPEKPAAKSHWLNTSSGVRHNSGCRWYANTKSGRACTVSEGRACGICGG